MEKCILCGSTPLGNSRFDIVLVRTNHGSRERAVSQRVCQSCLPDKRVVKVFGRPQRSYRIGTKRSGH